MRAPGVVLSHAAAGSPRSGRADDPVRLAAWLEARARDQCLQVLRAKNGTRMAEGPVMTGDRGDVRGPSGLRALFEAAAAGLGAADGEVVELRLRQGFADRELAAVLGVSCTRARVLLTRARTELESCLGALLVGRTGRG